MRVAASFVEPTKLTHCTVLVGAIEIQKLPVLNQGQSDLAITMSRKRDSIMGHSKKILVVACEGQSTLTVMQYGTSGLSSLRKTHYCFSAWVLFRFFQVFVSS